MHNTSYCTLFSCRYMVSDHQDSQYPPFAVSSSFITVCLSTLYTYHNKLQLDTHHWSPRNMDSLFRTYCQYISKYALSHIFLAMTWHTNRWCLIQACLLSETCRYRSNDHHMIGVYHRIRRVIVMDEIGDRGLNRKLEAFLRPLSWLGFSISLISCHSIRSCNYLICETYYFILYRRDSRFGWPYRFWAYLRKEKLERFEPIDYRDMTLNLLFFAFDSYYIFYNIYTFHLPSLKSKTEARNNNIH